MKAEDKAIEGVGAARLVRCSSLLDAADAESRGWSLIYAAYLMQDGKCLGCGEVMVDGFSGKPGTGMIFPSDGSDGMGNIRYLYCTPQCSDLIRDRIENGSLYSRNHSLTPRRKIELSPDEANLPALPGVGLACQSLERPHPAHQP